MTLFLQEQFYKNTRLISAKFKNKIKNNASLRMKKTTNSSG